MKVAVIGGGLQGLETTYLARKAGWEVVLIDRRQGVAAQDLADRFICLDVTAPQALKALPTDVRVMLPALENRTALDCLAIWAEDSGVPLAFDARAYAITSSKIDSERFFQRHNVPRPQTWAPDETDPCETPLIAKPSAGSGSQGIRIIRDRHTLAALCPAGRSPDDVMIQRYLPGLTYSLEVLGWGSGATSYQVTDLFMDSAYDCKRVTAPTVLPDRLIRRFETLAQGLAGKLNLRGIMDVEVVLNDGELWVLEIDARVPSQTPTAVFWSRGINLVAKWGEMFAGKVVRAEPVQAGENADENAEKGVVFEHVAVKAGTLTVAGEHIMSDAGPLRVETGFFGAAEAITNYHYGRDEWVATLINSGADLEAAWHRRGRVIREIQRFCGLNKILDPGDAPLRELP